MGMKLNVDGELSGFSKIIFHFVQRNDPNEEHNTQ
jgi:hypothetical protein